MRKKETKLFSDSSISRFVYFFTSVRRISQNLCASVRLIRHCFLLRSRFATREICRRKQSKFQARDAGGKSRPTASRQSASPSRHRISRRPRCANLVCTARRDACRRAVRRALFVELRQFPQSLKSFVILARQLD